MKCSSLHPSLQRVALALILCGCGIADAGPEPVSTAKATENESTVSLFYGQPVESVQQVLGEPNGTMTVGNRTVLLYSGVFLEFINGKLQNPQEDIQKRIADNKKALAKHALSAKSKPKEKAVKKHKPEPAKPQPTAAPKTTPAAPSGNSLYSSLLVSGKITVIDFYADWCGPCKQISPILDRMVSGKSDVYLRKVNIVDWNSSIAKKYNIQSIPNIRVFDKKGRMIGSSTSSAEQVAQYIEQARQSR